MRDGIIEQNCSYEPMKPVFENGGSLEHIYFDPEGSKLGTVLVTPADCGL